jgi:hypothetical protein
MTVEFVTPLVTRQIGAQRKRLEYELVAAIDGALLTIPAGFESDGASVPRVLWALYPPFGELYEPATWLHDFCYQHAESFDEAPMTRALADRLLYAGAIGCGFRRTGARNLWLGVRAGGWLPWRRARRRAAATAAARE